MIKSRYKIYFRYRNVRLWRNLDVTKLRKKKWVYLKRMNFKFASNPFSRFNLCFLRGVYLCHYKNLEVSHLYYYKFINKQILRYYLVNYKDSNFKKIILKNFLFFEKRLDFNLYQAHFVKSLREAKFFISKGCVYVNGKVVKAYNYLLKENDLIEINKFFFNFVLNYVKTLDNSRAFLYIRNLEIDYKTFSFIFLDKLDFYILNYNNFVKKIYADTYLANQDKQLMYRNCNYLNRSIRNIYKIDSTNKKKDVNKFKNLRFLNNYFNFFEYIFAYYLFLDKKYVVLGKSFAKRRTYYKLKRYQVKLLFRFIKHKYNDYFFRNILLKRIFISRYNYLKFLQKNIYNFNFENINKGLVNAFIPNSYNEFGDSLNLCSNFNVSFSTFVFNLILNYYILTLEFKNIVKAYRKNYERLDNWYNTSLDIFLFRLVDYKFINLFIYKTRLKSHLYYEYLNLDKEFKKQLKIKKNNKNYNKNKKIEDKYRYIINRKYFRRLKYKNIRILNYKKYGVYNKSYIHKYLFNDQISYTRFVLYLGSNRYKYRIYRHCRSFVENKNKRKKQLKTFLHAFSFPHYNCRAVGCQPRILSKFEAYNRLVFLPKIRVNKKVLKLLSQQPQRFIIYKKNGYISYRKNRRFEKEYKEFVKKQAKIIKPGFYKKDSSIYNFVYSPLIKNYKFKLKKLRNYMKKSKYLRYKIQSVKNIKNKRMLIFDIKRIDKQLKMEYNLMLHNKYYNNFNFNKKFKTVYLLGNLVNFYQKKNINLNLKNLNYKVYYKLHFEQSRFKNDFKKRFNKFLKNKKNNKYDKKRAARFNYFKRRLSLRSIYVLFKKNRSLIPSNTKQYFLPSIVYKNNVYRTYKYVKSNISQWEYFLKIYHERSIRFKKNVISQDPLQKQNRLKFLFLKHKLYHNKENFDVLNVNLIKKNGMFNDKLFFIDLLLNLSVRKLNINYNRYQILKLNNSKNTDTLRNSLIFLQHNIKVENSGNLNRLKKKSFKKKKIYFYSVFDTFLYPCYKCSVFKKDKKRTYIISSKILEERIQRKKIRNRSSVKYFYNFNLRNDKLINRIFYKKLVNIFIKHRVMANVAKVKYNDKKIFFNFNNLTKKQYIANVYKIYLYYSFNIKKYKIIKYLFTNYIFKEYQVFLNEIINKKNIKLTDRCYIKQLYYNLLFTKLFNFKTYDYILKNNYYFSRNLKMVINYFIIIKRFYKC